MCFFVTHGVRDEVYARRCNLKKTPCFTSPNACQSFCGLCVKSSQNLFCNASRYADRSRKALFQASKHQNGPRGLPGTPGGASRGTPGRSWGALGRSWDALGTLLGRSCGALGALVGARVDFGPFGSRRSTDFGATTTQRRNTGTSTAKLHQRCNNNNASSACIMHASNLVILHYIL